MRDRLMHAFIFTVFGVFCESFGFASIRGLVQGARQPLGSGVAAQLVLILFSVGLIVRLRGWVRMKSAHAARQRRAGQWNVVFGSPERTGGTGLEVRGGKQSSVGTRREEE